MYRLCFWSLTQRDIILLLKNTIKAKTFQQDRLTFSIIHKTRNGVCSFRRTEKARVQSQFLGSRKRLIDGKHVLVRLYGVFACTWEALGAGWGECVWKPSRWCGKTGTGVQLHGRRVNTHTGLQQEEEAQGGEQSCWPAVHGGNKD